MSECAIGKVISKQVHQTFSILSHLRMTHINYSSVSPHSLTQPRFLSLSLPSDGLSTIALI